MLAIGNFKLIRVDELSLRLPARRFPAWSESMAVRYPAAHRLSMYDSATGIFPLSVQSWIVQSEHGTVVIDTGVGNGKARRRWPHLSDLNNDYLGALARAGIDPNSVDIVINTHLHVDHVGWNTTLSAGSWVPTFPNATYLVPRAEYEWSLARAQEEADPDLMAPFVDSVLPIAEVGRLKLVEGNEEVLPGMRLIPCPGHSLAQMAVSVRSQGEEAVFAADTIHIPLEVYLPELNFNCADPKLATETRRKMLAYCAARRALILPTHFCAPYGGYVSDEEGAFSFQPISRNSDLSGVTP